MKKIILLFTVLSVLVSCGFSKEEISNKVKTSMQEKFDTDEQFKYYKLQIQNVTVIKQSNSIYKGLVKLNYESSTYEIPVDITVDESNVMWQTEPNVFNFILQNKLQLLQNIFK